MKYSLLILIAFLTGCQTTYLIENVADKPIGLYEKIKNENTVGDLIINNPLTAINDENKIFHIAISDSTNPIQCLH